MCETESGREWELQQRDCAGIDDDVDDSSNLEVANSSFFSLGVQWLAANQPAPLISFLTSSRGHCRTFLVLRIGTKKGASIKRILKCE